MIMHEDLADLALRIQPTPASEASAERSISVPVHSVELFAQN